VRHDPEAAVARAVSLLARLDGMAACAVVTYGRYGVARGEYGESEVLDLGYGMLDALRWTGETSCSVRIGEAWSILIERDPETTARTEVVVVMPAAHPGLKSVRRTMRRAEQEVARSTPHEPAPREED